MPMTKDERLRRQVAALDEQRLRGLVLTLAEALWGDTADKEWSADTLDAIAFAFTAEKIGESQPLPRTKRTK